MLTVISGGNRYFLTNNLFFFLGCLCGRYSHQQTIQTFKPSSGFINHPTVADITNLFNDFRQQWSWLEVQSRAVKHSIDAATEGVPMWSLPLHQLYYHFFLTCDYECGAARLECVPQDLLDSFNSYIHHILICYGKVGRHWRLMWNSATIRSRNDGVRILSNNTKSTKILFYAEMKEWYPLHHGSYVSPSKTNTMISWITRSSFHVAIRNPILTERNLRSDIIHRTLNIGHRGYITCQIEGIIAFKHCGLVDAYEFDWEMLISPARVDSELDSEDDQEVIDLTNE